MAGDEVFGVGSPDEPNLGLDMTRPDPARTQMEDQPLVGYTVKELLARMDGKLDAYARRQDAISEHITQLAPKVDDHEKRLKTLELSALAIA